MNTAAVIYNQAGLAVARISRDELAAIKTAVIELLQDDSEHLESGASTIHDTPEQLEARVTRVHQLSRILVALKDA